MSNTIIVLDPGHVKGYNIGSNRNYVEGEAMFILSTYLKKELEKYEDITVYNTRSLITDDPSLYDRGKLAVTLNADAFFSLHSNAASGNAYGNVIFRSIKLPKSEELANLLGDAITSLISKDVPKNYFRGCQTLKNGSGTLDYYGVIRHSANGNVKYSYIIEHGFHSTLDECNWLVKDSNLKALAKVEATTIAGYFGKRLKSSDDNITPTSFNYVTKEGDTIETIFKQYYKKIDTSYINIEKLVLRAGQALNLPINDNYINNKIEETDKLPNYDYLIYTVKYGDSFWSIAQNTLGDPYKYTDIIKFNGFNSSTVLNPGDVIKIPKNIIVKNTYTVKPNDSWWAIAQSQLGSGSRYKELASYNNMSINNGLHPGDILNIPE